MIWIYLLIAGFGIAFNFTIFILGEAALPGPRSKTTFWGYVFLLIPFSTLLVPILGFLISPWRK